MNEPAKWEQKLWKVWEHNWNPNGAKSTPGEQTDTGKAGHQPSFGFFTNSTPCSSNLAQALSTSGTTMPIWPAKPTDRRLLRVKQRLSGGASWFSRGEILILILNSPKPRGSELPLWYFCSGSFSVPQLLQKIRYVLETRFLIRVTFKHRISWRFHFSLQPKNLFLHVEENNCACQHWGHAAIYALEHLDRVCLLR